ncbi:hypothetical protein [Bilophila wadsworthia]
MQDHSPVTTAPGVSGAGLVAAVGSAHRAHPLAASVITNSSAISLAAFAVPLTQPQLEEPGER